MMEQNSVAKIMSCKNPVLWYNARIGLTFPVTRQTDNAVWLQVPYNNNAWVYIDDVELTKE